MTWEDQARVLKALHGLKREVNRALDRVQVNQPIDDTLWAAMAEVERQEESR